MDINRGRDFGIPPYTTVRTLCGLPAVNRFEDLRDVMDDEVIFLFRIYKNCTKTTSTWLCRGAQTPLTICNTNAKTLHTFCVTLGVP